MKSERTAVTGASGMLGSHLVAELLRAGYTDITLPLREASRTATLDKTLRREGFLQGVSTPGLHITECALNDPHALREAFEGVGVVFHCAAAVSMRDSDAAELIETNVEIASHVALAAVDCHVRRLVHTSSVAALGGPHPGGEMIDESCELENMAGTSPYGVSKFLSENQAWRAAAEGVEVTVVNPGIILGLGDWRSGGSTLIIPFASSGIPFYTDGAMGYVDVRDVARAEVLLADSPGAVGQRFILSGGNMTYRELISACAAFAGRRAPFLRAGRAALYTYAALDAVYSKITGREPRMTRAAARSAMTGSLYDGGKVTRTLPGFEYTPVMQTLERVVKAYKDETGK